MLKQTALFEKLKKKKLSIVQYSTLYHLHSKPKLTSNNMERIRQKVPTVYINLTDCTLSESGIKLLKEIDALFKPMKKLKNIDLLGDDYSSKIEEFLELFPSHKLPSGKYARGNKKNVELNFMWFFVEFEFSWDVILKATKIYITEYHKKNYDYMRTAMYFIKKIKDGTPQSELANYCDIALNKTDYIPERHHSKRVV